MEFGKLRGISTQHQTGDILWTLLADETDKTRLDYNVLVMAVATNFSSTDGTWQDQETLKDGEERSRQEYTLYLLKLYAMADQVHEAETDITNLHEVIKAQSIDYKCRQDVTSVWKATPNPNSRYEQTLNACLFNRKQLSTLCPIVLRSIILHLCHYMLLAGH